MVAEEADGTFYAIQDLKIRYSLIVFQIRIVPACEVREMLWRENRDAILQGDLTVKKINLDISSRRPKTPCRI